MGLGGFSTFCDCCWDGWRITFFALGNCWFGHCGVCCKQTELCSVSSRMAQQRLRSEGLVMMVFGVYRRAEIPYRCVFSCQA